jgi:V/A-type H+-transporting ATPase subunit B
VRELGDMIGAAALSATDRRYLDFDDAFGADFAGQRRDQLRGLDDTLDRAWQVLLRLPRGELLMLPTDLLDEHEAPRPGADRDD